MSYGSGYGSDWVNNHGYAHVRTHFHVRDPSGDNHNLLQTTAEGLTE